ncbi:MAG: recombinase family protein [Peptostreptococcaceae bacterium]|nr:recombinase family protein [Peptostreptococcaceae bacterium]
MNKNENIKIPIRVAAYCRVSTNHSDQRNSFEAQKKFFAEQIDTNPDWELVAIYADQGLSGTSTKGRIEFKNMIIDANVNKKIDLIITKEVSRFARNTLDTLTHVRELISNGVNVFFVNDNINTMDKDGEFRLTLMASLAQDESRRISDRVTWGMDRRMEDGFVMGNRAFGFNLKTGVLSINEEEAEIVRLIFHKYLHEGKGQLAIAKELISLNIPTHGYVKKWSKTIVSRILSNEKYVGDLKSKMHYTPDFLNHKTVPNKEENILFFSEHHKAIIDRQTWLLVQEELDRRRSLSTLKTHYSNRYWASGKIVCGECGTFCVSRNRYNKDHTFTRFWYCKEAYTYGKKDLVDLSKDWGCNGTLINDTALLGCIQFALEKITLNKSALLQVVSKKLESVCLISDLDNNLSQNEYQVNKAIEKRTRLIDLFLNGTIGEEELSQMKERYTKEINALTKHRERLIHESNVLESSADNFSKLLDRAHAILNQDSCNERLYRDIVDKIVLSSNHNIDIYFKNYSEPSQLHFTTKGRKSTYRVECIERAPKELAF